MERFQELVQLNTVNTALLILAIAGPILGLIAGAVWGSLKKKIGSRAALSGFLLGLIGTLIWGLWHLLVKLQDSLGFDRVSVVILGVVIFSAVGVALGAIAARVCRTSQ